MPRSFMARRPFLILGVGLIAEVDGVAATASNEQAFSAAEILERMADAYANCATYQDIGEVTTAFLGDGEPMLDRKPFSTAFLRPGQFRFEFKSEFPPDSGRWKRYIVWAKGAEIRVWWDVHPGIQEVQSLGLALAGATGISSGSAHSAPAMLMPGLVGGVRLSDMVDPQRIENAPIGGVECFRVQGGQRGANDPDSQERMRQRVLSTTGRDPGITTSMPDTLWIDRSLFVVRRIDHATESSIGHRVQTTTTYEPLLNRPIADNKLLFNPPAG